jgi:hypothetical protein
MMKGRAYGRATWRLPTSKVGLTLLLTACGPITHTCPDEVFGTVEVEEPLECPNSKFSALAEEMLIDSELWPDFQPNGIQVFILRENDWASWGQEIAGQTVGTTIYVGKNRRGLLHELMHVQLNLAHQSGADPHQGWDRDGRWAMSNLFSFITTNDLYVQGSDCPLALPQAMRDGILSNQQRWSWSTIFRDWDKTNEGVCPP